MAEKLVFSGFFGLIERLKMWQSNLDTGCERL